MDTLSDPLSDWGGSTVLQMASYLRAAHSPDFCIAPLAERAPCQSWSTCQSCQATVPLSSLPPSKKAGFTRAQAHGLALSTETGNELQQVLCSLADTL